MSVRMRWGHVCQLAEIEPAINLTRIFDAFTVPPGSPGTALPVPSYLVMMMEADRADGGVHEVTFEFRHESGKLCCDPANLIAVFTEVGDRFLCPVRLEIGGWILEGTGQFSFRVLLRDQELGRVNLLVHPDPQLAAAETGGGEK